MKIRSILLILSFLFILRLAYSQQISLQVPIKQEVKIGEEINVVLKVKDIKKFKINMSGNPSSAIIENNTFMWTPKKNEKKYYLVKFQLIDSTQTLIDETDLALTVIPSGLEPFLITDRNLSDTIKLLENERFSFTGTIKSRQNTDPKSLRTYFTFNEDPNLRTFDSCRIILNGDQLLFRWTPSNKEAIQEYLKFRITIVDSDQSTFNQVLNFKIKNINQEPYFKNQIPDTVYVPSGQIFEIDYAAVDTDNDKLKYDYSPKSSKYMLHNTSIVFKNTINEEHDFPIHLALTVSDSRSTIKRSVVIMRDEERALSSNNYLQPIIGDFTRKIFSEGDSVLTYLNISNYKDLNQFDITYTDLYLPPGINSLTKHLIFEKKESYIKIYSKGILPYSLINRDYNYNISVLISSKNPNRIPSFKVLVLTIENRPDPKNIAQQKDSLTHLINNFLKVENLYQYNIEKIRNRINRPWWKKVALITGTLSGVLTIIQSEHSDKAISVISASISLLSIMVSNIPSLSEKTLSEIDEKIAHSKGRIERVQEKENEMRSQWLMDIGQSDFDRMKIEMEELISKSTLKRNEDICSILNNKKIKTKIDILIKKDLVHNKNATNLESIFKCERQ
jgi:hypothetical protein